MAITRLTQRKCKAVCFYILSWVIATLCTSLLFQYGSGNGIDSSRMLFMLQLSLFCGLSHAIYDVMILQDEMDGRPVATALLIRSWFFLASICANLTLCILIWKIDKSEGLINEASLKQVIQFFKDPSSHILILSLFLLGHLITFIRSVHKKFGTRVFMNTLLGKYQDPKEEDLIFMFIDMKHSTEIAEELGHVTYSNFIRDYYKLLSNCCEENHGEIYQIAGDGVFLTWKTKDCRRRARPLECFHDFAECLDRTKGKFLKRYGVCPAFKAAAHCGNATHGVYPGNLVVLAGPLHQSVIGLVIEYGSEAGDLAFFHGHAVCVQHQRGDVGGDDLDLNLCPGAAIGIQQNLGLARPHGGDVSDIVHHGHGLVGRAVVNCLGGLVGIQTVGQGVLVAGAHPYGTGMGIKVVLISKAHRGEQQHAQNQHRDQVCQLAIDGIHGSKPSLLHIISLYIIYYTNPGPCGQLNFGSALAKGHGLR